MTGSNVARALGWGRYWLRRRRANRADLVALRAARPARGPSGCRRERCGSGDRARDLFSARASLPGRNRPSAGGAPWDNPARQCCCNHCIRRSRYQEAEVVVAHCAAACPAIHLDAFARAYQSDDHTALFGGFDRCRRYPSIFGCILAWRGGRHVGSAFVLQRTQRRHYRMSPSPGGRCCHPCQSRGGGVADRIRRQHRAWLLVGAQTRFSEIVEAVGDKQKAGRRKQRVAISNAS